MYLFEPPPFGGIEGLPHFVKFPAKAPSPLDNRGHSFVSLYHAEAKGGKGKSRMRHPHAGVEDGTGDG